MRVEKLPYDVLGVRGIAATLLSDPSAVPGLILPRNSAEIPEPPERFTLEQRDELATALETGLLPLTPHVAVLDAVRQLRQPGTCVVIAGQQPGLFASPLYNIHKALHVVRLARTLSAAWERPVVAMFWNHGDDHDLAEVNHAFVANENFDLQKLGLSSLSSGRQPFSRIVLSEAKHRMGATRATLEDLLRSEPHCAEALDLFCPREGETLARAFSRTMTELFGALGLVVLEPDWIRAGLSGALIDLLADREGGPNALEGAVQRGADAIRAVGHVPQIDPSTAAFLYHVDERGRNALRLGSGGLQYDGEQGSRTRAELAALIHQDPSAWAPAALTRVIVQDSCLPVAAYVGGLGELAYHAQLLPLRDFAGVPRTPFVPRFACTLIEPDVEASLVKLGVSAESILRGGGAPTAEDDGPQVPQVIEVLRGIGARTAREVASQREALAELDAALAANLKRTGEQMQALLERICEKAERVHQNKSGRGQRHLRRVATGLFPRGLPQERVIGPLVYVARYGRGWIEDLLAHVPAVPREHLLAHMTFETKESR